MNLYVETSAVLAWLFGEPPARRVRSALASAKRVLASDLTLVETDRVLIRALRLGQMSEAEASGRGAILNQVAAHWDLLRVDAEVVERARRPFPVEPIRTLDALHLASALVGRSAFPGLALLSLDQRVRECGRALGFKVVPD